MPGFLAWVKSLLPLSADLCILPYMTATVTVLADRVQTVGQRTRATVQALKGYRTMKDQDIAGITGWTRQKVQSYVSGPTKFTAEALAAFAVALQVPDYVLLMDKDDALRWVLDHSPNGPTPGQEQSSTKWSADNVVRFKARRLSPHPMAA